jgi:hypothetical protein
MNRREVIAGLGRCMESKARSANHSELIRDISTVID